MKTRVGEIVIYYSKEQKASIDDIKRMIHNNYELILKYSEPNKKINISHDKSNFNDEFNKIVSTIYSDKDINRILNNNEFLSEIYLESLIRNNEDIDNYLIMPNKKFSDEFLSTAIAYKYFESNRSFKDFVEYLKIRNREKELFDEFKNNMRWYTLNDLLNRVSNYLKNNDTDFYDENNKIVMDYMIYSAVNADKPNVLDEKYPKISSDEFDILFYDFMDYIKAPNEWKNKYNKLKENNLLLKTEGNKESKCFLDTDGVIKISITDSDNIKGVYNFIHEFIHYIQVSKNGHFFGKVSTAELPNIFFENVFVEFLKEKNVPYEYIEKLYKDRDDCNREMCINLFPVLLLLHRKMNNREIDKDDIIEIKKKMLGNNMNQDSEESLEIMANGLCDLSTYLLIHTDLIDAYQYLIGSYLAGLIYEKKDTDKAVVSKMISLINNLHNLRTNDILIAFNIDNYSQEEISKVMVKKK